MQSLAAGIGRQITKKHRIPLGRGYPKVSVDKCRVAPLLGLVQVENDRRHTLTMQMHTAEIVRRRRTEVVIVRGVAAAGLIAQNL